MDCDGMAILYLQSVKPVRLLATMVRTCIRELKEPDGVCC